MDAEELGMDAEELGMDAEELGMDAEELGMDAEELGMDAEELGMDAEELGMDAEELGMDAEELGMDAEELGMDAEELGMDAEEPVQESLPGPTPALPRGGTPDRLGVLPGSSRGLPEPRRMAKRRQQLVCEHVENLSSGALEEYADVIRQIVGRRHGVYALYRRDKLYYVGLAMNLRNRLKNHLRDRHGGKWDRFSVYLTVDSGFMKEIESLVIRIVMPKGNRHSGRFARSEDLRRKLRRLLKQRHLEEWRRLIGFEEQDHDEGEEVPRTRRRRAGRPARDGKPAALAEYFSAPARLRARCKGKTFKARIRADGTIRFAGKTFRTPSMAGVAALGRSSNGWTFWHYERAPGQWVPLDELRRR